MKLHQNTFLRFLPGNMENLLAETRSSPLPARRGDYLRFLVPKNNFQNQIPVESYRLVLLSGLSSGPVPARPVLHQVGTLRRQICETTTRFTLRLNSFAGRRTQFILTLPDGRPLYVPFENNSLTAKALMALLATHIERYPYAYVQTQIRGSLLSVTMRHNALFQLHSMLSIALGEVPTANANHPTLRAELILTYTRPAATTHALRLRGTLVEGNVFTFATQTHTVQRGDTVQLILNRLLPAGRLTVPDNIQRPIVRFDAATRFVNNTLPPAAYTTFEDIVSSNARYRVRVDRFAPGNIITVTTANKSYTRVVTEADTAATIEAALNLDAGGYFTVPQNDLVNVRLAAGRRELRNDNTVEFFIERLSDRPALLVDKYRILVGSDIVKGNIFRFDTKTVHAETGDDNLTIAAKLVPGAPSNFFDYEMPAGAPLVCFAEVGADLTDEDLTDIEVLTQPYVEKSSHFVAEINIGEPVPDGNYILASFNTQTNQPEALCCALRVGEHPHTSLLEASDQAHAFDYHYGESGLSHRVRVPLLLKAETPEMSETRGVTLDGDPYTHSVRIAQIAPFSTDTLEMSTAKALFSLLKHAFVFIDSKPVQVEDLRMMPLSNRTRQMQIAGTMRLTEQTEDNYERALFAAALAPNHGLLRVGFAHGLQLSVSGANFAIRALDGNTVLPAGEYRLLIAPDMIHPRSGVFLTLRGDETQFWTIRTDGRFLRKSPPIRISPGDVLTLSCESTHFVIDPTSLAFGTVFPPETVLNTLLVTEYEYPDAADFDAADFSNQSSNDFNI